MKLDCERIECTHYGGLGCHGGDDPMNQTACLLDLNEAMECLSDTRRPGDKKKAVERVRKAIQERIDAYA